jgi:cytochrome c553
MSNRTRPLAAAAGALVLGVSLAAQAGDDPSKPELLTGASAWTLAEPCFGCHGTDGQSQGPATPSIAGMDTDELKDRMKAFRDGKAPSTVMGRISRAYTDDEIALLAGWYAAKPFKPPNRASTRPWRTRASGSTASSARSATASPENRRRTTRRATPSWSASGSPTCAGPSRTSGPATARPRAR